MAEWYEDWLTAAGELVFIREDKMARVRLSKLTKRWHCGWRTAGAYLHLPDHKMTTFPTAQEAIEYIDAKFPVKQKADT